MGCRQQEQRPEENEIYIFFHKMEKEVEFNYTIEDYEKNYEQISQLSKNKFKKLEKKQSVRIGFVNEIMKTLSKLNISEREDRITRKILFYSLVLTLTLNNFLKENENNSYIRSNNDLQQSLLTLAVQTLDNKFENIQNLKLILYYIAKMLVLLFKEMNDIDQYINIEKYIQKLNNVTEQESILDEKEIYPFIKVNLCCLGEYFLSNLKENNLKLSSINILTYYFVIVVFAKTTFISEHYDIYKKEIFSEKYLFKINQQTNDRNKYYDKANRKKTIASIKNIDILIRNNRTDKLSNKKIDDISSETDNSSKLTKDQNFLDLNEINESFYYFFKSVIHDISGGKKIFEIFFFQINDFILKKNNDMRVNTKIPDFQKTNEILLLLFFVKCKINYDNVILYSFMEFESEKIKEGFKNKEFFNNFVMIFIELFKDDKDIYDKNLKILSQIFIIEIGSKKEDEEFLIEKILNFSKSFNLNDSRFGLFISFLVNVIKFLKEEKDNKVVKTVLGKICVIFDKLKKNNNDKRNKIKEEIQSCVSSPRKIVKYKLNKEEFDIILHFCDFGKKEEKGKNDFIKKHKKAELFNSYLNFIVNFLIFIDTNFSFDDVYNDIPYRKYFYQKIISVITRLEIMAIEEDSIYINELTSLIRILVNVVQKNTNDYFVDFEIIYKYLNKNFSKIAKIKIEEINIICFKLIYSISIFIITQIKKIFRIPSSMQKLHNEIVEEIYKINKNYKKYINDIDIYDYKSNTLSSNSNSNDKFYQNLVEEFSNEKNNDNDLLLSNKEFKKLIDLIYRKLFGKNSPLIVYFKSQGNSLNDYENEFDKFQNNKSEMDGGKVNNLKNNNKDLKKSINFDDFDNLNIEEERNANDSIAITVNQSISNIIDMSLKEKRNASDDEDDESEISRYSDTFSQNINIPENFDDTISCSKYDIQSKRSLLGNNSFRDDNSLSNFKV